MRSNYLALIQGGEGPDVWDREVPISAADFRDAANQAIGQAEDLGGHVVSLDQNGRDGSSHTLLLLNIREVQLRAALLEFVRVETMFGHTGQHTEAECADCKRVNAANTALSRGFLKS